MSKQDTPRQYHQVKNRLFFIGLFINILFLCGLFFGGFSVALKNYSAGFALNTFLCNAIYLMIFSVCIYAINFPLHFFESYVWEHRFSLSNQSLGAWFKDEAKKSILSLMIFLILMEGIYLFLGKFPDSWWIWAGIFWLFLTFVMAKLVPTVIIPIFFKYTPIDNEELKSSIQQLFTDCQVPLKGIYAIDLSKKSKKANAFLCGMGKNRRVVLSDTLIDNFSASEIEVVVAHELAHYKHQDIIRLLFINTIIIFISFFFASHILISVMKGYGFKNIADIALFPVFMLVLTVFGFLITPFLNWFSRVLETDADRFAIQKTERPQDFISMMKKLADMNLAEYDPSLLTEIFFYDHPPIAKRIKFAEKYL